MTDIENAPPDIIYPEPPYPDDEDEEEDEDYDDPRE